MKRVIVIVIILSAVVLILGFGTYKIIVFDGMSLPCTEIGVWNSSLGGYVTLDGDYMYKFDSDNNYSIYTVSNGVAYPYDDEDEQFRRYDLFISDDKLYQGDVYDFETKVKIIDLKLRMNKLFDRANSQVPDFPALSEYTDNATNTLDRIGSFFAWFGSAFTYVFRFIGWLAGRFVYLFKFAKIIIEGLGVQWNF